jgi:DNA polymerase III delta prime subunit
MRLYDKYAVTKPSELIGHDDVKRKLAVVIGREGFDRGAFLFSGPSGVGKTSIAFALARAFAGIDKASEFFDLEVVDGDTCTVEMVHDIERRLNLCAAGPSGWKAVVVNECHAMTSRAVQAWLTLLERIPGKRLVFFTTTKEAEGLFGDYASPFGSRCYCFALKATPELKRAMAERAQGIAQAEGLDGQDITEYAKLVNKHKCNFREVLNAIEMGEMAV